MLILMIQGSESKRIPGKKSVRSCGLVDKQRDQGLLFTCLMKKNVELSLSACTQPYRSQFKQRYSTLHYLCKLRQTEDHSLALMGLPWRTRERSVCTLWAL